MKRLTALILAVALTLILSGCGGKKEELSVSFGDVDFSSVTKAQMQNAHNGTWTEITEPEDVKAVCEFLKTVSGKEGGSAKGWYEGTYALQLMEEDGSVYFHLAFGDSDAFFYGSYGDGYPVRYVLDGVTIQEVTDFLGKFDASVS